MRHYIRYDGNGELIGCDTRTGGWPVGADPRDSNTSDPTAQWLNKQRVSAGLTCAGWAAYDCPCPRDKQSCLCPYGVVDFHYFNGVVLFPKPQLTVIVNGAPYDGSTVRAAPVVVPAGSTVTLQLLAATIPGHQTELQSVTKDQAAMLTPTLTFADGQSNVVNLIAPPQGVTGILTGRSKYVRRFFVTIKGWG